MVVFSAEGSESVSLSYAIRDALRRACAAARRHIIAGTSSRSASTKLMSEPMTGRSLSQVSRSSRWCRSSSHVHRRNWRGAHAAQPQYEAESQVLVELAGQMIDRLPAFWSIWSKRS